MILILPTGRRLGLPAFAGSGARQRGGILQVWLPAGGFVCLAARFTANGLMTGQRQVRIRSRPGANTCVVGQETMADVPGIPKPDAKLLAGCSERGGSQVFYITRRSPPACSASQSSGVGGLGPPSPEAPEEIRECACVSAGQSTAPAEAFSRAGRLDIRDPWLSTGCGGTRGSQGMFFYPAAPWCPGWKRNRAVSLEGMESSHPALFLAPLLSGRGATETPGPCSHPAWKEEAGRGKGWVRKAETGDLGDPSGWR